MNTKIAEEIGKKARAYKYAERLIDKVDKQGRVVVKFGNTGIVVPVEKGDVMYTFFQSVKYQMLHEMTALEVTSSQIAPRTDRRSLPAPVGAAPVADNSDAVEKKEQGTEQHEVTKTYSREYYQKHRESILARQKAYREKNSEKIKASRRKYAEGHREQLREYARSYYAKKKAERTMQPAEA